MLIFKILILLFLGSPSCFATIDTSELCPVTRFIVNKQAGQKNDSSPTYFTYPTDIYNQESRQYLDLHPCFAAELNTFHSPHNCSQEYLCPVHTKNLADAFVMEELRPCLFLDEGNDDINVLVLGDSFASGVTTGGCCDGPQCFPSESKDKVPQCGWVGQFTTFLHSLSPRYKVYNMAHKGVRSEQMSHEFLHRIRSRNITLKRNDVVFIDHSASDTASVINQDDENTFQKGIEMLIRRVLSASKGSLPTVILLESWPFPKNKVIEDYTPNRHSGFDYSTHYRKIARYYNITVWSLKNVAWSSYAQANQSTITPYLRYLKNYQVSPGHRGMRSLLANYPAWHVHLFNADIIASLFIRKFFSDCPTKLSSLQMGLRSMPQPLKLLKDHEIICDEEIKPLFHFDFKKKDALSLFNDSTVHIAIEPPLSWGHKEDRQGKYGLVSVLSAHNTTSAHRLSISLPNLVSVPQNIPDLTFIISHIKTFSNAGVIRLFLCDKELAIIDSLWKSWESTRYSTSKAEIIKVPISVINDECKDKTSPSFMLKHAEYNDTLASGVTENHAAKTREIRTIEQKFRIDSVELCVPRVFFVREEPNDDLK